MKVREVGGQEDLGGREEMVISFLLKKRKGRECNGGLIVFRLDRKTQIIIIRIIKRFSSGGLE